MRREFCQTDLFASTLRAMGADAGITLLTALLALAKNPEAFQRRLSVRIIPAPEIGPECVLVEIGHDPADDTQAWSAVLAVGTDKLVGLYGPCWLGALGADAVAAARSSYADVLDVLGTAPTPWP